MEFSKFDLKYLQKHDSVFMEFANKFVGTIENRLRKGMYTLVDARKVDDRLTGKALVMFLSYQEISNDDKLLEYRFWVSMGMREVAACLKLKYTKEMGWTDVVINIVEKTGTLELYLFCEPPVTIEGGESGLQT